MGVIAVDRFQDRLLFTRHEGRVARAPFVIVAQQVENSMDEEAPEFLAKPMPEFSRLTPSRRHRDDHITQQKWGQATKSSLSPFLVQGEREDVGGAVFFPVLAIEGAHAPIGNQHQAKLRVVSSRGRQDGLENTTTRTVRK